MNRVFIIEPPRTYVDTSKASAFGDIYYVFNHEDRRCSVFHSAEFGRTVLDSLKTLKFDNKSDFICVVGPMLTVTISIVALSQTYDELKLLLFDSVHDKYVSRIFKKSEWKGHTNEEEYSPVEGSR